MAFNIENTFFHYMQTAEKNEVVPPGFTEIPRRHKDVFKWIFSGSWGDSFVDEEQPLPLMEEGEVELRWRKIAIYAPKPPKRPYVWGIKKTRKQKKIVRVIPKKTNWGKKFDFGLPEYVPPPTRKQWRLITMPLIYKNFLIKLRIQRNKEMPNGKTCIFPKTCKLIAAPRCFCNMCSTRRLLQFEPIVKGEAQGKWADFFKINHKVEVDSNTQNLIETTVKNIQETFQTTQDSIGKRVLDSLTAVSSILITAAVGNSKASWITGIVSSFCTIGVLNLDRMASIVQYFTGNVKKPESANIVTGNAQGPSDAEVREYEQSTFIAQGLTLLFQSIGTYCGISEDVTRKSPESLGNWSSIITKNLQVTARSNHGMLSFFRTFVDIVKQMIKYVYFKFNPEVEHIMAFWEHSEVLRKLIEECDKMFHLPIIEFSKGDNLAMLECLITIVTEIIVRIAARNTDSSSAQLLSYFTMTKTKLVAIKADCNQRGLSYNTRIVPYAVALCGDSGVGKSHVLNELAYALSPVVEVSAEVRGKVFTKKPGSKFYDGLTTQEIIAFDDFCQIKSGSPEDCDAPELFQIITDQPFRPNMADLKDKGRVVDTKLVLMAMNDAYPKLSFISDHQALWRRRNQLIKMVIRPNCQKPTANTCYDPTFNYAHFYIEDPLVPDRRVNNKAHTFEELKAFLLADAVQYMAAEKSKLNFRLNQNVLLLPSQTDTRQPLRIEDLETALIAALDVTPDKKKTVWEKCFFRDYQTKVAKWLRARLPFLFESPVEDIKQLDMVVEKTLSESDPPAFTETISITKETFTDFLQSKESYNGLTKEQQEKCVKLWAENFHDLPFPDFEEKAEGQMNVEPSTSAEDDKLKKILQETGLVPEVLKIDKQTKLVTVPENHILRTKYKIKETPYLTYMMINSLVMSKAPFSEKTLSTVINAMHDAHNNGCSHVHFRAGKRTEFPHCFIDSDRNVFEVYNCQKEEANKAKCILTNAAFMSALDIYDCFLYYRIMNCSRYLTRKSMVSIQPWRYISGQGYYKDLISTWCQKTFHRIKPKVSPAIMWLWRFIKFLLWLIVPLGAVLAVFFTFRAWHAAKDSENPGFVSTVKNLRPHVKQQFLDLKDTRGKSLYNKYDPYVEDGEASYTIATRVPSGTTITPSHIAQGEAGEASAMYKIYKRATTFLNVKGFDRTTHLYVSLPLRVLCIGGHWILLPKHYLVYINTLCSESLQSSLVIQGKEFNVNLNAIKIANITNNELCLMYFENMPRAKDIRKHFASQEIWNGMPVPAQMNVFEVTEDDVVQIETIQPKIVHNFGITINNDLLGTLPEVLAYDWAGSGRCMSLIIDSGMHIRGCHIAGNGKKKGYASIVTRELLMELGSLVDPADIPFVDAVNPPKTLLDGVVQTIGKVEAKYEVHLPCKTSIRPSEIHGVFPIRTVPAPLRPCIENNYTDPLVEGIKKHGMPTKGFDRSDMDVIEQRFTEMLIANVRPLWTNVGVRSIDTAIRGVEGVVGFKSLVLSTSEGFPYICERQGQASKKWLIHAHIDDTGRIEYSLHDKLIQEYTKNMEMRKQGIVPPTVNVDCLKDARLPIEKAYTPGKVRIFSVAPTDFVIAFRQYFADFMVSFTASKFNFYHALGIAPETMEWSEMVQYMLEVGNKFLTGDYSNFGPGFDQAVFKAILRARMRWYEEYTDGYDAEQFFEDQKVREIMNIETSEPIHLARDLLYKTFSGMCSGSPSTTIDNCCVNIFYIMIAYYNIMKKHDARLATLDAMHKHLRLLVFGDDVFMCVSDNICEIFNNVTLQEFFASYGIKYTDSTKTGEIRKYCSLQDATFLKRSFVPHPYYRLQILGAVEKRSIEDCANWINKSADPRSASIEASYAALQLAYGWGPRYFNEVREKIRKAWHARRVVVTLRTWDDYDRIYNKRDFPFVIGESQGPPTSTPGEVTTCEESQDTIIQDHAPPDEACPVLSEQRITEWAGVDIDASYERVVNRYVLIQTLSWPASATANSYLKFKINNKEVESTWNLPVDAIVNNLNTPTMLPFLQHKYGVFDMDIKVVVNANKFMVGQLLVAWYYLHLEDDGFRFRNSIYNKSQMLHAIVDAGTSNSVQLCIPYKNYRPWIHIGKDANLGSHSTLGQLSIKVLSQLTVPSTTYSEASVSVYIKFTKASFMGVVPRNLNNIKAEAQMLPILTTMAASYLMQRSADSNRDKPPVQLPPSHMQPTASSSLGIGTGASEPLQAMRLDAKGQVPHPDGVDASMDIYYIAKQPGLLTSFIWKNSNNTGNKLWTFPVTPTVALETLHSEVILSHTDKTKAIYGYAAPPISVVSGLMTYWRGSMVLDFSVISSQFHTGRLLVAFCPSGFEITSIKDAQSLPYVIYDIHDDRAFSFVTPYIADKPWWPCGYINGQTYDPPGIGNVYVFVLNELIPMDSVASEVNVLVYLRAHDCFELSVPRQPVWALPWNLEVDDSTGSRAKDGYAPYYFGGWRYVNGGNTYTARYGAVSDHVAQFSAVKVGVTGVDGGWFYYTLNDTDPNFDFNKDVDIGGIKAKDAYFIPVDVGDSYGAVYMFVAAKDHLKIDPEGVFPTNYEKDSKGKLPKSNSVKGHWIGSMAESAYLRGNPMLKREKLSNIPKLSLSDLELSDGQAPICEPTPLVKSTNAGLELFGEKYNDGKDYSRRYEPLFRVNLDVIPSLEAKFSLAFDVLPSGNSVPMDSAFSIYARDGGQALLASAFRFFRGSMNYKIINNFHGISLWLEHRPDRKFTGRGVRRVAESEWDRHMMKNYAQVYCTGTVNRVTTINVPFYQAGSCGLLQCPTLTASEYALRAYTLGEVLIHAQVDEAAKSTARTTMIDVLRAIGDDMRYYTYTGFPLLVNIDQMIKARYKN